MSTYKTLITPIVEQIILREIGEANIAPLKWNQVSLYKYKFLIDIDDYTEVVTVEFQPIEDEVTKQFYLSNKYKNLNNVYNVGYDVSGNEFQFKKSSIKILLQILSTVVDIIKNFIEKINPNGLYIRASIKSLEDNDEEQKMNLYKAYTKKQLDILNNFSSQFHRNGLILIKIK